MFPKKERNELVSNPNITTGSPERSQCRNTYTWSLEMLVENTHSVDNTLPMLAHKHQSVTYREITKAGKQNVN